MSRLLILAPLVMVCGCLTSTLKPGYCESDRDCPAGSFCYLDERTATAETLLRCFVRDAGSDTNPGDGGDDGGDGGVDSTDSATPDSPDLAPECVKDEHCPAKRPICIAGVCGLCTSATPDACGNRDVAHPVCAASGSCVECVKDEHCSTATKPICSPKSTCEPCDTDSQCADKGDGPGVCMTHQDHRCASEVETIYVQNLSPACNTGTGTAAAPYCDINTARAALTATRRLMVVRGSGGSVNGTLSNPLQVSTGQISIIGQQKATISGAANPALHFKAGDVYMRGITVNSLDVGVLIERASTLRLEQVVIDGAKKDGLHVSGTSAVLREVTIRNSEGVGIIAEQASTMDLDQVVLEANKTGGLRVTASAYDVQNCLFIGNGGTRDTVVGLFGGAFLGAPPTTGPARFAFNTVVGNKQTGVVCDASSQLLDASLFWNTGTADQAGCAVAASKVTADGDPKLVACTPAIGSSCLSATPYRLGPDSACRNAVSTPPSGAPDNDIDGAGRPQEGVYDCGASEFTPAVATDGGSGG